MQPPSSPQPEWIGKALRPVDKRHLDVPVSADVPPSEEGRKNQQVPEPSSPRGSERQRKALLSKKTDEGGSSSPPDQPSSPRGSERVKKGLFSSSKKLSSEPTDGGGSASPPEPSSPRGSERIKKGLFGGKKAASEAADSGSSSPPEPSSPRSPDRARKGLFGSKKAASDAPPAAAAPEEGLEEVALSESGSALDSSATKPLGLGGRLKSLFSPGKKAEKVPETTPLRRDEEQARLVAQVVARREAEAAQAVVRDEEQAKLVAAAVRAKEEREAAAAAAGVAAAAPAVPPKPGHTRSLSKGRLTLKPKSPRGGGSDGKATVRDKWNAIRARWAAATPDEERRNSEAVNKTLAAQREHVFCVECGKKNALGLTHCAACSAELEQLEGGVAAAAEAAAAVADEGTVEVEELGAADEGDARRTSQVLAPQPVSVVSVTRTATAAAAASPQKELLPPPRLSTEGAAAAAAVQARVQRLGVPPSERGVPTKPRLPERKLQQRAQFEVEVERRRSAAPVTSEQQEGRVESPRSPRVAEDAPPKPALDVRETLVRGAGVQPGPQGGRVEFVVALKDNHASDWLRSETVTVEVVAPNGAALVGRVRAGSRPGTFVCTYTRALAGGYLVSVLVNGASAGDSPYRVESFAVVDPSKCVARGAALENGVQSATPALAVLELRDLSGEPAVTADARVFVDVTCGGRSVDARVVKHGNGTYGIAMTRLPAGEYHATVLVDGTALPPFVFAVAARVARFDVRGDALGPGPQSAEPARLVVACADLNGDPVVPADAPVVACTLSGTSVSADSTVPVRLRRGADGYEATVTRAEAGTYRLVVTVDDLPPQSFAVAVAQVVDASRTELSLDDAFVQGARGLAQIRLFDLAGRPVIGLDPEAVPVTVTVARSSGGNKDEAFVRVAADVYRARFDTPDAGDYVLTVQVAGTSLPERRFQVRPVLDTGSVRAVVEGGCGGRQSLTEPLCVCVSAADASGRPYDMLRDTGFSVLVTLPSGSETAAVRRDEGRFTVSAATAGSYRYVVRHRDLPQWSLEGSAAVAQVVDPTRTVAEGPGVQPSIPQALAAPAALWLRCFDVGGAPMRSTDPDAPAPGVDVTADGAVVPLDGPVDQRDGTFAASFPRRERGAYVVTVRHADHERRYEVAVVPEADVEAITVECAELAAGRAEQGRAAGLVVRCKDLTGRSLANQAVSVTSALVAGGAAGAAVDVADRGDGSYEASVAFPAAGAYVVSVQVQGRHVADSPYRVTVPQRLDRTRAVIASGLADEMQQSTATHAFTVQLFDVGGERMASGPGAEVTVEALLDGAPLPLRDSGDGTLRVEYGRARVGRYAFTVRVDGQVVVSAGATVAQRCDPAATAVVGLAPSCRQGEPLRFSVVTFDVSGAKMERGGEPVAVAVRGPRTELPNVSSDQGDGVYACEFTPGPAGAYAVAVLVAGAEVCARDVTVQQVGSAARSRVAPLSPQTALPQSAAAVDVLQVEARDLAGDPFLGSAVEFGLEVGGLSTPTDVRSLGGGSFVVSTIPSDPGAFSVTAAVAGDGVLSGSPMCMEVRQVADLQRTTFDGEGFSDGPQSAEPVRVLALVVDVFGQPFVLPLTLSVSVEGPSGRVETVVQAGGDGSFAVHFVRLEAGKYTATVLGGEELINLFFFDVRQTVDPHRCVVAGAGLEDGILARRPAHFLVELRDLTGVVVPSFVGASPAVEVLGPKGQVATGSVARNADGTFTVTWEPDVQGAFEVGVKLGSAHLGQSPFAVTVAKPPTAGSQWQNKFNAESEERRLQREKERLAEIEQAKSNFIEHAKQSQAAAKAKEEAELAEKKRLRDIAEHMERMRTAEGEAIRKQVVEKVRAAAVDREFEPLAEDEAGSKTGQKWAAMQQAEVEARNREREAQRKEEIDKAKSNYLEHAAAAVNLAKTHEQAEYEEKERLRKIAEHQLELSRAAGYK